MRSMMLTSNRFGFEPELTARLAQAQARIGEVPISYSDRIYAEGKQISSCIEQPLSAPPQG